VERAMIALLTRCLPAPFSDGHNTHRSFRARQTILLRYSRASPTSLGFPGGERKAAEIGPFRAEPVEPRVRIHLAPPTSPSPFGIGPEMIEIRAPAAYFARLMAAESATNLANCGLAPICLCSEEIRCHERILCDRDLTLLRSLDRWILSGQKRRRPGSLVCKDPLLRAPFDRKTGLNLQALG
jgi:hypothetical protein